VPESDDIYKYAASLDMVDLRNLGGKGEKEKKKVKGRVPTLLIAKIFISAASLRLARRRRGEEKERKKEKKKKERFRPMRRTYFSVLGHAARGKRRGKKKKKKEKKKRGGTEPGERCRSPFAVFILWRKPRGEGGEKKKKKKKKEKKGRRRGQVSKKGRHSSLCRGSIVAVGQA